MVVKVLSSDEIAPVWIDSIDVTVGGELIVLTLRAPIPGSDKFEHAPVFRCAITPQSLRRSMETFANALRATQGASMSQERN
jgi:hypothetical protein